MRILAIETSCDETAISVIEGDGGLEAPHFRLLAHAVASQIAIHAPYGGVVPNLAKREHLKNLPLVLEQALHEAHISNPQTIDLLAVTHGPGLEPALWAGITFAQDLSREWQKPLIPVNHMEGHIVSPLISSNLKDQSSKVQFPALALLISGGHTELVLINNWLDYKVIGQTRDDAVGEAFDKVARLLDLPYPGGPEISALAEKATSYKLQSANEIKLPRPMIHSHDFDFSFSGLKTAVLYLIKKLGDLSDDQKAAIAKEFQDAVIEVLINKTMKALKSYQGLTLIIGGGVIANQALRQAFTKALDVNLAGRRHHVSLLIPNLQLATDNATMIGMAAYLRAQVTPRTIAPEITANGNLSFPPQDGSARAE